MERQRDKDLGFSDVSDEMLEYLRIELLDIYNHAEKRLHDIAREEDKRGITHEVPNP